MLQTNPKYECKRQDDPNVLNHKLEGVVSLQRPYIKKILRDISARNSENATSICNYIIDEQTQFNIKESTKEGKIKTLVWLSAHFNHSKSFYNMTKDDILSYLNGLRKPLSIDPNQRWIGSYNGRQLVFSSFFRWIYDRDEQDPKKRTTPSCMLGIRRIARKLHTPYKPSDLFTASNNEVFLKHCPSKRDRCFHAMAIDTSARPHELLNLRIKDIVFKTTDDGKLYGEITITGGKSNRPRTVPLINSIPYIKDWISTGHPTGANKDSWLFVSLSKNRFGLKLSYDGLYNHYVDYLKSKFFPSLLERDDGSISELDKSVIRDMLLKPWSLYNLRHSSLTEKSLYLKEHVLRNHAGWSMSSKMPQVYIHYFGNESSNSILQAAGILKSKDEEKSYGIKTKSCPNCREPNTVESRFCAKCMMILSYDDYIETIENKEKQNSELKKLKDRQDKFEVILESLIESGQLKVKAHSN
jgi:integrase